MSVAFSRNAKLYWNRRKGHEDEGQGEQLLFIQQLSFCNKDQAERAASSIPCAHQTTIVSYACI